MTTWFFKCQWVVSYLVADIIIILNDTQSVFYKEITKNFIFISDFSLVQVYIHRGVFLITICQYSIFGGNMYKYYVNPNADENGNHEVHREGCYWLSLIKNPISLGWYFSCFSAVGKARMKYNKVDGCKVCSEDCHKR